jgi:phospholipase C
MNGFVQAGNAKNPGKGAESMRCFNSTSAPILNTLAMEFGLFNAWHASVPGPTEVNRAFIHSATSHGMGHNDMNYLIPGLPQRTLYDMYDVDGVDYMFAMEDITTYLFFESSRKQVQRDRMVLFDVFLDRAVEGTLPAFTFIDPRYFSVKDVAPANDQHPDHSVEQGEELIKRVYEALRSSPQWNETLFLITYDEHGGFYDHVAPPQEGIPNPDGLNTTDIDPPFHFERLGLRVPTVAVSPWIKKGSVFTAKKTHYEHSSLIGTMSKLFNLTTAPLTARDAWAETFESIWSEVPQIRTDCPRYLPPTYTPRVHRGSTRHLDGDLPMNDFQESLFRVAAHLAGHDLTGVNTADITEHQAGKFIAEAIKTFLEKKE